MYLFEYISHADFKYSNKICHKCQNLRDFAAIVCHTRLLRVKRLVRYTNCTRCMHRDLGVHMNAGLLVRLPTIELLEIMFKSNVICMCGVGCIDVKG